MFKQYIICVKLQHLVAQKGSHTASIFSGNALGFGFLDHVDLEICKNAIAVHGEAHHIYVEEWQESVTNPQNTRRIKLII